MASLKNSVKFGQRIHKERGQLIKRKHLGLLEKHKDYVLRARDFHRKEKHIKLLQKKAKDRNPDEFYYNMISQKTKDGVHQLSNAKQYTAEEMKLMKTQDLNYINMKRSVELNKISKMKESLHLLDSVDRQPREHLIFLDSSKEVRNFDAAEHFNTIPDLIPRCHNRLRLDALQNTSIASSEKVAQKCESEKKKAYNELAQRMKRKEQLETVRQELEIKKKLTGKGARKPLEGTTKSQPKFKWRKQRAR